MHPYYRLRSIGGALALSTYTIRKRESARALALEVDGMQNKSATLEMKVQLDLR